MKSTIQLAVSKITTVVKSLLKSGQIAITDLTVSHHQIIRPRRLTKKSFELWLWHFTAGIFKWSFKFFSHREDN